MSIAEKFVSMEYGPAPEDPKEAQAWLERHRHRFGHFLNGAWQAPLGGEYFDTLDPSNGEKLAAIAMGSSADIDAAVSAARSAFPKWRGLTRTSGRAICMRWPGWCKNIPVFSRFWKPWTTASRSARAAISTFL